MSDTLSSPQRPQDARRWSGFFTGSVNMLPLCLSVVPWGILAGSMAVQSGLTLPQSVGMSALVFAGAAQLVTLGLLASGAGVTTIVLSVFFITSQHFLYALSLRDTVSRFPARFRLPTGFLLCDELFALSSGQKAARALTPGYLIGAGLTFYLCWNLFSLAGILLAASIPDLSRYHLDFSIVATFITLVVPMIKRLSVLAGVLSSLALSMVFSLMQIEGAVMLAGLTGMAIAVMVARSRGEVQ